MVSEVMKQLKQAKFGVYQAFAVKHAVPEKPETCHTHVGIVLRQKPNTTWDKMKAYFAETFPETKVTESPLKVRGNH